MAHLLSDLPLYVFLNNFNYNKVNGELRWTTGRCKGQLVGTVFEAEHGKFYWRTKIIGRNIFNHRIAWFMEMGEIPDIIDHRDGDGLCNIWTNLREATQAQNFANQEKLIRGVDPFPNGKWRAKITVDRNQIHLGMYNSKEEALEVYRKALEEVHGDYSVYRREA